MDCAGKIQVHIFISAISTPFHKKWLLK